MRKIRKRLAYLGLAMLCFASGGCCLDCACPRPYCQHCYSRYCNSRYCHPRGPAYMTQAGRQGPSTDAYDGMREMCGWRWDEIEGWTCETRTVCETKATVATGVALPPVPDDQRAVYSGSINAKSISVRQVLVVEPEYLALALRHAIDDLHYSVKNATVDATGVKLVTGPAQDGDYYKFHVVTATFEKGSHKISVEVETRGWQAKGQNKLPMRFANNKAAERFFNDLQAALSKTPDD